MKLLLGIAASSLLLFGSVCVLAEDQEENQAELDAACEEAREAHLIPLRQQMTEECIAEGKKDESQCEADYANHSGRRGNRQLPFYDLPECDKAFKNRKAN